MRIDSGVVEPFIEAAVLVQIADLEGGDLRAPQADLQADAEKPPIAQAGDGIFGRCVEHLARLGRTSRRVEFERSEA